VLLALFCLSFRDDATEKKAVPAGVVPSPD
jgi:hypothetical protein